MPNLVDAKIYAIRSFQTDKIYIGSTCQPLYKRFYQHKKNPCSSSQIMKYPDWYIELLENYDCADKNELHRREGELIRTTMNCVNQQIAGRTRDEHYVDNKQEIQQYYQDNKELIHEKHKQYYVDNKQEINEKNKQYYLDNKEQLKEKQNQKYNCFCSGKYTRCCKTKHFKSKKHIEFIRQLSALIILI